MILSCKKHLGMMLLILGCAAQLHSLNADDGITVTVRSGPVTVFNSTVFNSIITIGDAAVVTSNNATLENKVRLLDLDNLTDGKVEAKVSREQIRMRMLLAGVQNSIDFRGEHSTSVILSTREDVVGSIESFVKSAFVQQFSMDQREIQIRLSDNGNSPEIAKLSESLDSAMVVFSTEMPIGEAPVRIDFTNDSGGHTSLTLKFRFTMNKEFVVAKRPIPSGATIRADDVTQIRRPVDGLEFIPATLAETIGHRVNADIPVHGVLRATHLTIGRPTIQINRNDLVDVIIKREGMQIWLKNAKALTPGSLGDTIQVVNPSTQKRLIAVVVDQSLVEIKQEEIQ